MRQVTVALVALEAGCLALVSGLAQYRIHAPDVVVNREIALMLTPAGLAANLADPGSALRPFYFRPSGRAGLLESPALLAAVAGATLVAWATLAFLRRKARRPRK